MQPDLSTLHADWDELLQPFHADPEAARRVFAGLVDAYSSGDRHYHTLAHIHQVLTTITMLRAQARDLAAVRCAAWFHDVIYDSKASDNEERSAARAEADLVNLRVPAATRARVRQLILLTKTHQAAADDSDGHILLDADLAILGAPPADYARYARAIRQEYAWVPEEQYRAGRLQVLQTFLQRPRLYRTKELHEALETQARRNLECECAALTPSSP